MADTRVEDEAAAAALTGAEILYCVQAGGPRNLTVDRIAAYAANPPTSDGRALGSLSLQWSDLFVASGAVLNFGGGAYTVTQSGASLLFSGNINASGIDNVFGGGGTGNSTRSNLILNGGSGTTGGGIISVQENSVNKWFFGSYKGILGGSTQDFLFQASGGANTTLQINYTTGVVTIPSAAVASGVGTGALIVGGGGSYAGDVYIGGKHIVGSAIAGAGGLEVSKNIAGASVFVAAIANTHNTNGDSVLALAGGPTGTTDTGTIMVGFYSGNYSNTLGNITRNGASAVAYNLTSDERGKPFRERLAPDYARSVIDALEIYDFDKDGNSIRGIGVIAQQAYSVHKSFATPGTDSANWKKKPWMTEKAAPMPFVIANLQQLNARLDALEKSVQ